MTIDWAAADRASHSLSGPRRRWKVKHTMGICGVGRWMRRWRQWTHEACPRCGVTEDAPHVVRCPGFDAAWSKELDKLSEWVGSAEGAPGVADAISASLSAWREGRQVDVGEGRFSRQVRRALDAQGRIGWGPFAEGFVAMEWRLVQERHFTRIGSRRSGLVWVSSLIERLWNLVFAAWDDRNVALHRGPLVRQFRQQRQDIDAAIRSQWIAGRAELPPRYRRWFQDTLQDLLSRHWKYKVAWLRNVVAARDRAQRRRGAGSQCQAEQELLCRWLHSAPGREEGAWQGFRNGEARRSG